MRILWGLVLLCPLAWADGTETIDEAVESYIAAAKDEKKDPRKWKWKLNIGATVTTGNSDTFTFSGGLEGSRKWDGWEVKLRFISIYSESESVETANEHILTIRLERELTKDKDWIFLETYFEHDEQEELNLRSQATVGYKRRLVDKEKLVLHGEAGIGVLHEEFRDESDTELIAQLGIDFVWQITEHLTYTQRVVIWPSLSEGGEFRLLSISTFETPVGDRAKLKLEIIDRFDSDAPAGVEENDLTVSLLLGIEF